MGCRPGLQWEGQWEHRQQGTVLAPEKAGRVVGI